MSRNIWVISDLHWNHTNIIRYCDRPFRDVDEMNKQLLANWNDTVKPDDIVYDLGDVYIGKNPWMLPLLHGRKRLILGNHDDGKNKHLLDNYQKITIWRAFPEFGLLLTHVPVHPNSLNDKWPVNVHGHDHNNSHRLGKSLGAQYKNVCVEMINYRPINIEELRVK